MWLEWLTVLLSPWSWKHQEDPGWVWLECGISLGRSCHAMGIFLYLLLQVPLAELLLQHNAIRDMSSPSRHARRTSETLAPLWVPSRGTAKAWQRRLSTLPEQFGPTSNGHAMFTRGGHDTKFWAWADQHETWMKHIETQHQPKCDPEATSPNVLLRSAMKQSWQSQRNC